MTTEEKAKEVSTEVKPPAPLIMSTSRSVGAIIPQDIDQAYRISTAIFRAGMAPKTYDSADKILVGILHGMELGLTPMAALQSIAVINGMPTIWGDGALGLVQASGLLEDIEETIEGEGTAKIATCVCKRVGRKSEIRRTFSMEDAKTANLLDKQGPWKQYPQRMLQMRARSWALRDGFADVLRGLGVTEEAQDMTPLVQAADGSYVPAGRPLRQHYLDQADKRKVDAIQAEQEAAGETETEETEAETEAEAEAETETTKAAGYQFVTWEGEVEDLPGGHFVDRMEIAITMAKAATELDALWENNQVSMDLLLSESDQTRGWHDELVVATFNRKSEITPRAEPPAAKQAAPPAAETKPEAPTLGANGSVELLELGGSVLQTYKRSTAFFGALKQMVARAKPDDRRAVIDLNTAAAEYWVKHKSVNAASFWAEIQALAPQ